MSSTRQRVTDADDGRRLDDWLRDALGVSRTTAAARISAGAVRIGGRPATKSARVRAGEVVTVEALPPPAAPPPPPAVPVRYADPHLAVVAKPAGLVVHPGAGVTDGTLVDALRAAGLPLAHEAGPDRPGIVHRLDRGTSGLLVVACDRAGYLGLRSAIDRRAVTREYRALVEGVPDPPAATIDAPIDRDPRVRTRFRVAAGGRPARTHYDVRSAFGPAADLDLRLETGRTHQIRVHLASLGHRVCGDLAYGAAPELAARLGLVRPALHAARLAFRHPVTGLPVEVTEPLPDDLASALERLREQAD